MNRLFQTSEWTVAIKLVVAMTLVTAVALAGAFYATRNAAALQLEEQIGN
jgi:hypothetical protein